MDEKQKELLNRVIENRAEMALDPSLDAGEREQAYKEAMGAYDRATKVAELEASQKQAKENRILEWVRVGVVGVAVPVTLLVIKEISKWKFGGIREERFVHHNTRKIIYVEFLQRLT